MTKLFEFAFNAPKFKLPHSRIEPLTKVTIPILLSLPLLPTVTPFVTTNFGFPVDENVNLEVPAPDGPTARELHTAFEASTVTV